MTLSNNLEVQFIDGKVHLILDPTKTEPRAEEKANTELVASTHGWTGWLPVGDQTLKFSVNIVRRK